MLFFTKHPHKFGSCAGKRMSQALMCFVHPMCTSACFGMELTGLARVATTLLQVEQARDNFNDHEAVRLKKLARLTGIKDDAKDSKPKAK